MQESRTTSCRCTGLPSNPFPDQWIKKCREEIRETRDGSLEETFWMRFLMKDARQQLTELEEQLRSAYAVCLEADGPQVYQNVLMEECEMLWGLKESSDYRELNKRLVAASLWTASSFQKQGRGYGEKTAGDGLQSTGEKGCGGSERALRGADRGRSSSGSSGNQSGGVKTVGTDGGI